MEKKYQSETSNTPDLSKPVLQGNNAPSENIQNNNQNFQLQ